MTDKVEQNMDTVKEVTLTHPDAYFEQEQDTEETAGRMVATVTTGVVVEGPFGVKYKYAPEFMDEWIGEFMARQERDRRLPMPYNHDIDNILGSVHRIEREGRVLRFYAQFEMENQNSREVFNLLRNRHISGVSMGYRVEETENPPRRDSPVDFIITKARLDEISVTPMPRNTSAKVRQVEADASKVEVAENDDGLSQLMEAADIMKQEREAAKMSELGKVAEMLRAQS